jgi:hypothetical protein
LFGCLIGSAECLPFLTLLKQRFGNPKKLTAPRFVHTTHSIDGVNFFEFMKYDFRILRKDHFNSRQELLDAFKNGGFQYFFDTPGSSTIPPDNWDAWLPLSPALVPRINPSTSNELSLPFGATISPAVDGVDALIIDMASWDSILEQYTENGIPMNRAVPTDPAGLVAFVEEAFGKDPAFQTSHPYPIHKRFHNVSLHDFAAGWNWNVTAGAPGTFNFVGTRYRYDLLIPVTLQGADDKLLYNYYPASGSPTINFTEDDARLFGSV